MALTCGIEARTRASLSSTHLSRRMPNWLGRFVQPVELSFNGSHFGARELVLLDDFGDSLASTQAAGHCEYRNAVPLECHPSRVEVGIDLHTWKSVHTECLGVEVLGESDRPQILFDRASDHMLVGGHPIDQVWMFLDVGVGAIGDEFLVRQCVRGFEALTDPVGSCPDLFARQDPQQTTQRRSLGQTY